MPADWRLDMYSGFTVERDLVYGRAVDKELTLDFYVPNDPLRAVPVIVYIHGGAWSSLDKSWCPYPMRLLDQEYAVASINYRLLGEGGRFPAHLHDCKAAVRWVRAHAAAHGLDGDHIAVWGDSAGGHLAALVGLTGDRTELEGDVGTPGVSSRVQAVCTYFGAMDLVAFAGPDMDTSPRAPLFASLIGAEPLSQNVDKLRAASPVTYASVDAPPFLILHGDVDTVVPLRQSVFLYEALWQAGADVRLYVVHGGDHLSYDRSPPDIAWHTAEIKELEDAFFYRTLKAHERSNAI
jgi:acetyl esterase/lipase